MDGGRCFGRPTMAGLEKPCKTIESAGSSKPGHVWPDLEEPATKIALERALVYVGTPSMGCSMTWNPNRSSRRLRFAMMRMPPRRALRRWYLSLR